MFEGVVSDPQSLHKYLSTHADPVNGVDPTGRMNVTTVVATVAIGVSLGALAGYFLAGGDGAAKGAVYGAGVGLGIAFWPVSLIVFAGVNLVARL